MPAPPTTAPPPTVASPWEALPETVSPLRVGDRVLVVGAHPDDETIGAGRLLAAHVGPVSALTLTLGERCVPSLDAATMGRRRYDEWLAALAELRVTPLEDAPHWPDGALADHEDAVAAYVGGLAGDNDVLVTTWRHDPHPDHRAAGRAVATAAAASGARLVEFPVWAPYWLPQEAVGAVGFVAGTVSTTTASGRARDRALAAYPSQTGTLVDGVPPIVPRDLLHRHPAQIVMVPL